MLEINGSILKVVYYNKENGYCVLSLSIESKKKLTKEQQKLIGNKVTCVGVIDRKPIEDEEYSFKGEWVKNERFGEQFKFESYLRLNAQSEIGIISYLSSNLFEGIGVAIASKLYDKFGKDTIEVIRKQPELLDELNLTEKQKASLRLGVSSDTDQSKATIFLLENGLTSSMARSVITTLTEQRVVNIIEHIKENPYMIMDSVDHFGFKKADDLALKIGLDPMCDVRLRALLTYIIKDELFSTGNSYLFKDELYELISRFTGGAFPKDRFEDIVNYGVQNEKIVVDSSDRVFEYDLYHYEVDLAQELVLLLKDKRTVDGLEKFSEDKINDIFNEIQSKSTFTYNAEQIEAITKAFTEPIVIITGGPGTGKTTIIKAIIEMYCKLKGDSPIIKDKIALLAPTGRAAKRLSETSNMPASTIHRFLDYQGEDSFYYDSEHRTDARLLIVDEASMMDTSLASHLITSMNEKARIIIVGDVDQLPSVGPGQVLKDLIDSKEFPTIRLTKIHRQAEDSSIIKLARNINEGLIPDNILDVLDDRVFINVPAPSLQKTICDVFQKALNKGYTIKDIQVLIPMYRGSFGITEVNNCLQELLNPLKQGQVEIRNLGRILRIGDKVIQLNNRQEKQVMNGDIGYIDSFEMDKDKVKGVKVLFDNKLVPYELDELDDISLAYAISIHKSQGSEFDVVIMPFDHSHFIMLKRKLIYTAVTRCKKKLILLGDVKSLKDGAEKIEQTRTTILKEEINRFLKYDNNEFVIPKKKDKVNNPKIKLNNTEATDLGDEEIEL